MNNKELVILAGKKQGGGSVTPASIVTATGQMTAQQKAETRANIGATDASTSIPDNVKQALLACFADVAWADDQGQAHYDALEAALYPLDHITAVYTQSGTVYDTDSLDSLKADLVVTAVYEGGNTATVAAANYTLSGTLTVGTSTITVSYGGKTATFDVTVATHILYSLENRDFDTEQIDTEIKLLETDHDWSIAFDANITTNPTSGDGSAYRLVALLNEAGSGYSLSAGKGTSSASGISFGFMGPYKSLGSSTAGRQRFVLTHLKNSGVMNVKYRKDTGSANTDSVTGTFTATSRNLRFGQGTTTTALPKGTINKAYVYDIVLPSEQIDAFLGL